MITYYIDPKDIDRIEDRICNLESLKKSVGKACALVEGEAKEKCPVRSGELRGSIQYEVKVDGETIVGEVFTPNFYAPYVEYGTGLFAESGGRQDVPWRYQDAQGEWHTTSGQHPQPFMRPALDENVDKIKGIIAEGLIDD